MEFLKRAKNSAISLGNEITLELAKQRETCVKMSGWTMGIGTVLYMTSPLYASADISALGTNVKSIVAQLYNAAFPVITVVAALLLVIAFIMRMTASQQKAAQATSWIVRIIICYILVNCIGLFFKVIDSTTSSYRFST